MTHFRFAVDWILIAASGEPSTGILVATGLALLPVFIRLNTWLRQRAGQKLPRHSHTESRLAGVAVGTSTTQDGQQPENATRVA